jgi:hypothetical protein
MGDYTLRKTAVQAIIAGLTCGVILFSGQARAESQPPAQREGLAVERKDEYEKQWQAAFMAALLIPRLEESEGKIDHLINGKLGALFPRWENPVSFGDWRDNGRMFDFHLGLGRDINPKWSWMATVGGTAGFQSNPEVYFPLGVPMGINVTFERKLWFVTGAVDYFPWGKPQLGEKHAGQNPVWRRLFAARPYVEGTVGYVNTKAHANIEFRLPIAGKFFTYQDKGRYDSIYVSPRVGIDIPITQSDSISLAAGYLFFTSHQNEFNNVSIYTIYRHRFGFGGGGEK